jgi:archaemetzincin
MSCKTIYILLLFLFFCSCNNNSESSIFFTKTNTVIDIQPFNGITAAQADYVFMELKKNYPFINIKKPIDLPVTAYYPARKRYRADSLINYLSRSTTTGHKTVGLTNKDISATKNDVVDWGVMGLGFRPGKSCIASTFRLSKAQTNIQLFKVAIHELGHTFGLPHCPIKYCFMRNAEGGNPTNEEKEFCTTCKVFLKHRGWTLN